uniref:Reverse transcriptase Ty1/copia-type domain-containing protein n=1 Tax=Chromera velia CCMP2878 TaxID=1169474 RepID=A0A0G4H6C0_9ALVE|eukprot:Cvel_24825.t1-p1 / transcript=Cvel_24825.t1 / gene=Cvel_24825 / organism=Chromera_velia_CCMP2878 / gene_product=hypothetical protein / transcript_product=hypothetical protein / location=Cvel_scaffold2737:17432-21871(-) / protein_length=503 / sequence_SO=supercontig / SO=protein_coding / is_pseudo=false
MRNSFAPLGSDFSVSSAHCSPVFAAASATMPGNESAPSTSSTAAIKLPDLSWIPELKTSHDWKSQEEKVRVAFAKDFKTWRRSFEFTTKSSTKFIMTFVEKEEHVVALWNIFLKLERGQHGREDIVKAMKRLKDTIRECGAMGYKPDADLKRRALKSMLTKSEWNDSTEKAFLKTGNKVSELTYEEILVYVDTKIDHAARTHELLREVNATENYGITRPVDGRSSSSPPKRNHEFGAAADRSQRLKGRGKGRRGKKSNRKENSFQGEGGEESQSGVAASGAASSSQTWPCPNCGHMKHLDSKKGCPAANVHCSFEGCGMVGHYMKCCPKNPKRKQQHAKAAESALSEQSNLSEENKAHLLHVLHSRLGHAIGQRLEATLKEKELKDGKRVAKSRLMARGFQDSRDWGMLETYSGTGDPSLARVAFLWAVSYGLQAVKMDVSTAFLQAPIKDAVWLRLSSDLLVEVYPGLRAGVFVRIQKAVYGLKDAPKVYTSYFKKKVRSLG